MTRINEKRPADEECSNRFDERGEVWCNQCRHWVPQVVAGWQHRCASAWVWTCHACIRGYYERHTREVPDAVHKVEKVAPPSSIRSLWDLMEDLKDEP